MTIQTDTELIQKFLKGYHEAFNVLVLRWQPQIYSFLYRHVMNREEAEDLAQQVFITVYNTLCRLKEHDKFKCWLYSIAINKVRDLLRTRKKNKLYSIEIDKERDYHNSPELQGEEDPVRNAHQNELEDLIKIALSAIPHEQQDVLILKEYQGMTFEEIAEVTGCPVSTAKSRMYYGLKSLRQSLERLNIKPEDYYENM